MNNAERVTRAQWESLDDDVRARFQHIQTMLTKPIPNQEGLQDEFWIHRIPFNYNPPQES